MKERILLLGVVIVALVVPWSAGAAEWRLLDSGVGIWDDSAYDTQLKVVEKRDTWSMDELSRRAAFSGRGKVFGAWIVGPPADSYKNRNGVPVYLYKYRLTDPKGGSQVFGPSGFYSPGFTTIFINAGQHVGTWKIDWFLLNRDTGQERHILSQQFQITQAPPPAAAGGWRLLDSGVGIWDDAAYDTQLRIVEKKNAWSLQELMQRGAFSGRGSVFGAWIVGPPADSYKNQNGVPVYLYKYRLTDPKGGSQVFGPSGFYAPGFTTVFINASQSTGDWKIDWILMNRDTGQESPIGTSTFTILP